MIAVLKKADQKKNKQNTTFWHAYLTTVINIFWDEKLVNISVEKLPLVLGKVPLKSRVFCFGPSQRMGTTHESCHFILIKTKVIFIPLHHSYSGHVNIRETIFIWHSNIWFFLITIQSTHLKGKIRLGHHLTVCRWCNFFLLVAHYVVPFDTLFNSYNTSKSPKVSSGNEFLDFIFLIDFVKLFNNFIKATVRIQTKVNATIAANSNTIMETWKQK